MLASVSIPLVLSFDSKVRFYTKWRFLFPALVLTLTVFIPWDILFTVNGVWGFNDLHLTGIRILYLPVEEWLFFLVVPYASIFIYESLNVWFEKDILAPYTRNITLVLASVLMVAGLLFIPRWYTSVTFLFSGMFLLFLQFIVKASYLGYFYRSYLVILFPFFAVNGILTGTLIEQEVVWYNNAHNMGIRLLTIPVEDLVYGMLLILTNVALFEFFRRKRPPAGTHR